MKVAIYMFASYAMILSTRRRIANLGERYVRQRSAV
jgi:hypothetical protein